jgi:hypothetical protein
VAYLWTMLAIENLEVVQKLELIAVPGMVYA